MTMLAASASHAQTAAPAGAVLAAWVELSPIGPVVRAVTDAPICPRVAVLDTPAAAPSAWASSMAVRAEPAPPAFPNRVCEWAPPAGVGAVAIEGFAGGLRLPRPDPRRIVVIGDTGCLGGTDQDCAHDWLFPTVAAQAARRQPDLVIHVGDYNYRGTNCVAYDGCCTYNPVSCGFPDCGDNWANWQADFFAPAAPLLAAAPWVVARGNHELCSRAGRGFFRYLDPRSPPPTCAANPVTDPTFTSPYALYLGPALRLLVMDSANACGQLSERDEIIQYGRQFELLDTLAAGGGAAQTWWVSHRALWSIVKDTAKRTLVLGYTLRQASGDRLPASVSLLLSGHEHLFQSVTMQTAPEPTQLVVGTGGTELDDPRWVPEQVQDLSVAPGGPVIGSALTVHDHGYLLIERGDAGWSAVFHDRYDQPLATCSSTARPSVCTAAQ